MTDDKLLELWRGIPTPDGWQMDDIIVQFGRLVEAEALGGNEPFGEDGPDSEGFKGPRPWNGYANE